MPDMAESQCRVLIPLAICNCAELIRYFLPKLRIELSLHQTSANEYEASGEMFHDTTNDPEWQETGAIRFNGPGYLQINGIYQRCEFKNGVLDNTRVILKSGDQIRLVVRAGGIIVSSRPVKVN
jgi:hypothetical protein